MGMGSYNLDTARANSINAQTAITLNNAWATMTHEQGMIEVARRNQDIRKNKSLYDSLQKHLRENPGAHEIENGDASNVAVRDLIDVRRQFGPPRGRRQGAREPDRQGPFPRIPRSGSPSHLAD